MLLTVNGLAQDKKWETLHGHQRLSCSEVGEQARRTRSCTGEHLPVCQDDEVASPHHKGVQKGLLASCKCSHESKSPEYKFSIKQKFNKANTEMKVTRNEMKAANTKYGPNIADRAEFWNHLVDNVKIDGPDICTELTGYAKNHTTNPEWYRNGGALVLLRAMNNI